MHKSDSTFIFHKMPITVIHILCKLNFRHFWPPSSQVLSILKYLVGKKVTIPNSTFLIVKSSEMIFLFYLHFIWLCGHRIITEFLKNINFWEYNNCFSSEESKHSSVRSKLNLPLKYWFMEAKVFFLIYYGPKK